MGKLIRLSEHGSYDADHIVGVVVNRNDFIDVLLADGRIVCADVGYGETVWKAKTRLEAEINAAKTNGVE